MAANSSGRTRSVKQVRALPRSSAMRYLIPALSCLLATSTPAAGQLRVEDFGFGAGISSRTERAAGPLLSANVTLGVHGRAFELAVGSSREDAFFSASRIWRHSLFAFGGGAALYGSERGTRPGATALAALSLPLAPREAAALQLTGRVIATTGVSAFSLGFGVRLAPLRGGLQLGENVAAVREPEEVSQSWEGVVAQVMLLQQPASSLVAVSVTPRSLTMRFAADSRAALMDDVARVARVLRGCTEPLRLQITAPEAIWVVAAATAGGFPAERIVAESADAPVTIRVLREPAASDRPSGQW